MMLLLRRSEPVIEGQAMNEQILTLQEAADLLRTSVKTLREAVRKKKLRAAKLGKEYRITGADLTAYWKASGGGELPLAQIQLTASQGELFSDPEPPERATP
jgi:excisionase family DNA binding protein